MKTMKTMAFILLLVWTTAATAQSDKEKALTKGNAAIKLEDEGKMDEAIKMLEEAQKLQPDDYNYPYEIAYAYYALKDYKKAQKILIKTLDYKESSDRVYQLLGNTYDILNDSKKAVETYNDGLKKYPNSGNLYLELGVVQLAKKEYNKALGFFENGIKVAPDFPSNYYWATKIYCSSDEEVWGMIYGEIFMNLESGSKRTAEISKLLYDTYKSQINVSSDTSKGVSFSKNASMTLEDLKNHKMPFGNFGYEMILVLPVAFVHDININSLDTIRSEFVRLYYEQKKNKEYPNILFDYQKELKEKGYLSAYNHWLLMKGDETAFAAWADDHKEQWAAFTKWFPENRLKVDDDHKFYREQY